MNLENQEDVKSDETQGASQVVDKSRRSFAKAGMAAPVIMTMASRPVFGAQCLSDMLSTTQSHAPTNNCWGGVSPGYWKTPAGKIGPQQEDFFSAWRDATGASSNANGYGTLPATCPVDRQKKDSNGTPTGVCKNNGGNFWSDYTGGAPYSLTGLSSSTTPMRETLGTSPGGNDIDTWHAIAVWLNIQYAAVNNLQYIMTWQEFLALRAGTKPVPSGLALDVFLTNMYDT